MSGPVVDPSQGDADQRQQGTSADGTTGALRKTQSPVRALVLTEYFPPAVRAGGPPASIQAVVGGSRHELSVLCRDRDIGSATPFGPEHHGAVSAPGYKVFYADFTRWRGRLRAFTWGRAQQPNLLYLNSFHSIWFTMVPLLLQGARFFGSSRVILSPRGEFNPAALREGSSLKRSYIRVWKLLGLQRRLVWVASSEKEGDEIRRLWGTSCEIHVVPALSPAAIVSTPTLGSGLQHPRRRMVYVARISPIKGLLEALRSLIGVDFDLELDLYGPIEDREYWTQCLLAIDQLPGSVRVTYRGLLARTDVPVALQRADCLLAPTYGENFGHSIFEALANSCPVMVGRNTPWTRAVELAGAGWVIEPQAPDSIAMAVAQFATIREDELHLKRHQALTVANGYVESSDSQSIFDDLCTRVVQRS